MPGGWFVEGREAGEQRQRPVAVFDAGTVWKRQDDGLVEVNRRRTAHDDRAQHRLYVYKLHTRSKCHENVCNCQPLLIPFQTRTSKQRPASAAATSAASGIMPYTYPSLSRE